MLRCPGLFCWQLGSPQVFAGPVQVVNSNDTSLRTLNRRTAGWCSEIVRTSKHAAAGGRRPRERHLASLHPGGAEVSAWDV